MKRDQRTGWRVTKSEKDFLSKQLSDFRDGKIALGKKSDSDSFEMKAWDDDGNLMDIEKFCEYHNLPIEHIKKYKLVSHTGSPYFNIEFKPVDMDFEDTDFEEIIKEAVGRNITPLRIYSGNPTSDSIFNRAVYTDTHVGLNPNPKGISQYGGKWDREELFERCDYMINKIIDNQTSDILIVDDLADFVDGQDGFTTRGGHKLPQNMSNREVFDNGFDFKVRLVDKLSPRFASVKFNSVTNGNHCGDMGYYVNKAVKQFVEQRYPNVDFNIHETFLSHYFMGNHCFIVTHGKDMDHMKFGFKPHIDTKQIDKIESYIKHHKLYNQSKFIHVCKGDSHQALFDMSSSDDWDYMNYPAFAPSSDWVQTNFSKGRSGFVIEEYAVNHNDKSIKPYWFEWKS